MTPVAAVSLFCEDIREEKSNTDTIVGILPDNMAVKKFPGAFLKLSLYTRIHLSPTFDPPPLAMLLRMPNEEEISLGPIEEELIARSKAKNREINGPIIGLISRASVSGITLTQAGRITAVLKMGAEEYITGVLNVILAPES